MMPEGEGLSVRAALTSASLILSPITETPRLDAELLMGHALGVAREALLLHHLDEPSPPSFDALRERRLAREPLAYITGSRDFWTISLHVTPAVLIPRPDSETLIEAALRHFAGRGVASILDLGTGSGALLLAALSEWPQARGLGIDASPAALEVAKGNAERLGLNAEFALGNWAEGIADSFDLILCNPPYVETDAILAPEVLNEPHAALFAGADGLDDYRRLIPQIPALLTSKGAAVIEIGAAQASPVTALAVACGMRATCTPDLAGRDRCLSLQR